MCELKEKAKKFHKVFKNMGWQWYIPKNGKFIKYTPTLKNIIETMNDLEDSLCNNVNRESSHTGRISAIKTSMGVEFYLNP